MRTLDRYIVKSFLSSAFLLLLAVMALRIVADLFVNMDEFVEGNKPFRDFLVHVGSYYGWQSLMYFGELGGVAIVVAAAFTLARMNHTNELTAILASGVSLHRVIVPMVISAILLGGLIVLDRELLVPPNADKLVRNRDEAQELREFPVYLTPDGNGTIWWAPLYEPRKRAMTCPILTMRDADRKRLASVAADGNAYPAKLTDYRDEFGRLPRTLRGWDMTRAALSRARDAGGPWENTPSVARIYTRIGPVQLLERAKELARRHGIPVPPDEQIPSVSGVPPTQDAHYNMILTTRCPPEEYELVLDPPAAGIPRGGRLSRPLFIFKTSLAPQGAFLGIFHADSAVWVPADSPAKSHWLLDNGAFFYPTDLRPEELVLRQSSRWLDLMSISQLTRLLASGRMPNREAAQLARHSRVADPINNLIMLLLAMPFILSRERNIKASAGLSVLMVGSYFAFIHICRLVGLPPVLAAFLPILLFGAVAAVMLDAIKT